MAEFATFLEASKLALYYAWKCLTSLCGWWVGGVVVESEFSDQIWLNFSLAKPNKNGTSNGELSRVELAIV